MTLLTGLLWMAACDVTTIDLGGKDTGTDTPGGGGGGGGGSTNTCPDAFVSSTALAYPDALIGVQWEQSIVIGNADCDGATPLQVVLSWGVGSSAFSSDFPPAVVLAPGETVTVDVTFAPTDYLSHGNTIEIITDDPDLPSETIYLSGQARTDQDGDGATAAEAGGTDCDDFNPSSSPSTSETEDLIDNDCDGIIDENFLSFGDILITEVMLNPVVVTDVYGEWIELYNNSTEIRDLKGFTVSADDGDSFTIDQNLLINPGEYVVLAPEGDSVANGGMGVDYVYDRDQFSLSDSGDSVYLFAGDDIIYDVSFTSSWDLSEGASISLDEVYFDSGSTRSEWWCSSTSRYGMGDLGTPGEANDVCNAVDHDGDGYSVLDGDCDDSAGDVSPDGTEIWDGLDNDCDGDTDIISEDDAVGMLEGDTTNYLGYSNSFSVGDLDDDGNDDLIVGSPYLFRSGYTYYGGAYVIDGADWDETGDLDDYAAGSVQGATANSYLFALGPKQGDIDGDGQDDLFIAGSANPMTTQVMGGIFLNGVSGDLDVNDADITFTDSSSYGGAWQQKVLSHVDMDGDGSAEAIYANNVGMGGPAVYLFSGGDLNSGGNYDIDDADGAISASAMDYLGTSLNGGDLDGDGYDDLLVGAGYSSLGAMYGGAIYIVSGSSSAVDDEGDIDTMTTTAIVGTTASQMLGMYGSMALGDFNDDSDLDIVVSTPYSNRVYVFFDGGSLSGSVALSSADAEIEGSNPGWTGSGLAAADFDDDGVDDLAIGAPDYPYGGSTYYDPGAVYLFRGDDLSGSLSTSDANLTITSDDNGNSFGSLMVSGDFDDDGASDLAVAGPGYNSNAGAVWFFDLH